jgi:hypothetical protein
VISNGKWVWNRAGFGGRSALDYLIKVRGLNFLDAVEAIIGSPAAPFVQSPPIERAHPPPEKTFVPPPKEAFPSCAVAYLQERGIHPDVVRRCLDAGSLYESRFEGKPVCVFVGFDERGEARFAHMRGIGNDLKRDVYGSDKRFSFCLPGQEAALATFESPIDALSHACLFPDNCCHRLSLGGTSDAALISFLERNPVVTRVSLCLDSDGAGQSAAHLIRDRLAAEARFSGVATTIEPPAGGKDFNDVLIQKVSADRQHRLQTVKSGEEFLH